MAGFFATEVWTATGLVTWFTLFVIDLATHAVEIVGSTPRSGEEFMKQVARNLIDAVDGLLSKSRRFHHPTAQTEIDRRFGQG